MADIRFNVTMMEAEVGNMVYRLSLNKYNLGHDQWSLIRWPGKYSYQPHLAQILTISGWEGVLGRKSEIKYINMNDVEQYTE